MLSPACAPAPAPIGVDIRGAKPLQVGRTGGLRRFAAREAGDRLRRVPDAVKISISTINRACGL
jgi:hypothetical protein